MKNSISFRPKMVKNGVAVFLLAAMVMIGSVVSNRATTRHYNDDLLNRITEKYGSDASKRLIALSNLVDQSSGLDDSGKIKVVNDFFNRIPYYSDIKHWNEMDYWATPVEKLSTYGGDCEDYALAKYYTLRELGVEEKKLRIMYVKALEWNEAHMVLAYYPKPSLPPMVLDNIKKDIRPANERKDLIPVFSFNANGLYLAKAQGAGKRVGGPEKMKLWSNMMKRMDGTDI